MSDFQIRNSNDIALCVFKTYEYLPQKCKPLARAAGQREWVPLSGIVLSKDSELECVSLGTGMKCLPTSKIPLAKGIVLHDSHAEIIAIRAFNRFLIDECLHILSGSGSTSPYIRRRRENEVSESSPQPFAIQEDVQIHMYNSEAPCGDASMELTMQAQEDATPWAIPAPSPQSSDCSPRTENLKGRSSFSELGIVRRKPARPDAPPTLSKSCTDKLTMYQFTSVLGSLASLLLVPKRAYLSTLTIPESQHVNCATKRAFTIEGRLAGLNGMDWKGEYGFRPFKVQTTSLEFAWSRRSAGKEDMLIPSNISAVWTPAFQETLINGVLQGRKMFDSRGASKICRKSLWEVVFGIVELLGFESLREVVTMQTYKGLKENSHNFERRKVKDEVVSLALTGWLRNVGDDEFDRKQ